LAWQRRHIATTALISELRQGMGVVALCQPLARNIPDQAVVAICRRCQAKQRLKQAVDWRR
jgi:hypothetical protein